jgi:hypothetical protein
MVQMKASLGEGALVCLLGLTALTLALLGEAVEQMVVFFWERCCSLES